MNELNERRRRVLKAVIQQYIDAATPVASQDLARSLGVSSATVRNEMAALEDAGLLTHLHTSAGRIPTDAGYRYFVENLMECSALTTQEQRMIKHQFYQIRSEIDQWIHLAAAVLSRTAQNAALVTPPRAYESRFKHLELISINETMVLMVLVLHEGSVKQQTFPAEPTLNQEQLSRIAAHINSICDNANVRVMLTIVQNATTQEPPLSEFERLVLDAVMYSMQQFEANMTELIHHDGLLEMLNQPEFMQVARVREVLAILENGSMLETLIPQALASDGVQVIIGGEHGRDELRDYSMVLSRYGVDGEVVGVLGVLGPRRMAYPRSISTVRYIAGVLTDLMNDVYGKDSA